MRSKEPTKEDTLNALLKRLNDKRSSSGRPEELEVLVLFLSNQCFFLKENRNFAGASIFLTFPESEPEIFLNFS